MGLLSTLRERVKRLQGIHWPKRNLVSIQEAMQLLDVNLNAIYKMVRRGELSWATEEFGKKTIAIEELKRFSIEQLGRLGQLEREQLERNRRS
jgi:hypothetical protein